MIICRGLYSSFRKLKPLSKTTCGCFVFRNDLCNRIEEQEEDLEETMQKYKSAVDNYNRSQSELVGVNTEFEALKSEKYLLEERVRNLQMSNQQYETNYVDKSHVLRAEARAREAETKLEFEKSTTKRLETQINRLKDNAEKYQNQRTQDLSDKDREKVTYFESNFEAIIILGCVEKIKESFAGSSRGSYYCRAQVSRIQVQG